MTDQYRCNDATGEVYEFDKKADAYIFCGKLNGRSLKEFIDQKEERELQFEDDKDFF